MRGRTAGALAAAWLLVPVAAAHGASVTVVAHAGIDAPKGGTPPVSGVSVIAAPGEANRLTILGGAGGAVVLRDPSAPLVPGEGCAASAPGEVTCGATAGALTSISVDAGDGDDVVDATASRLPLDVSGRDGNDVLRGGTASDRYTPGLGDDVVEAAGGSVLYDERRAPVAIVLDGVTPSGEAGERDVLRGLTGAVGGSGDDHIAGSALGDLLDGAGGDDEIRGNGGDDDLDGGHGDDLLLGGDGDDALDAGEGRDGLVGGEGSDFLIGGGSADRLDGGAGDDRLDLHGDSATALREFASCGAGRDLAQLPDGLEAISTDCERVSIGVPDVDLQPVVLALPLRRTARTTYARLWCDARDGGDRCDVRLRIRRRNGAPALTAAKALRPSPAPRTLPLRGGRLRPREAVWVEVRGTQREDGDRLPLRGGFKVVVP